MIEFWAVVLLLVLWAWSGDLNIKFVHKYPLLHMRLNAWRKMNDEDFLEFAETRAGGPHWDTHKQGRLERLLVTRVREIHAQD